MTRPTRTSLLTAVAVGLGIVVLAEALYLALIVIPSNDSWWLGMDATFYRDLGARWLEDGSYYRPRQLAGPYTATLLGHGEADVLYPPTALILFAPASLLPAFVWWIVPVAILLWCVASWRPDALGIALMFSLLLWPRAIGAYLFGNSDIWIAALVAAGLRFGWPAMLVTIKPTFAPLAVVGIRRRSWWVTLVAMVALIVVTLPLWLDYVTALRNTSLPPSYSLGSLPLVFVPVVAWLRRSSPGPAA